MIRTLAERVLAPVVFRSRLPPESGGEAIYVCPGIGGLRFVFRSPRTWSKTLLPMANLLVKTGDVVWDVGANLGLFSLAAAHRSGNRVIAIEPDIDAVRLLSRSAALSRHEITPVPIAVGGEVGMVEFQIAKRARAANAISGFGSTQLGGVRETRHVPCFTLDSLLDHFPAPNLIKIDVEGAECEVMRGGEKMLSEVRPTIYCEVAMEHYEAIAGTFRHHEYVMFDGSKFDGKGAGRTTVPTLNTVAIPAERVK